MLFAKIKISRKFPNLHYTEFSMTSLTLKAPIATKVVCFSRLLKKPLCQTVWTRVRLLLGAVCSGSTLFASILNLSVMLGNFLQQTTSADDIFRCIFFLGAFRVKVFQLLQFLKVVCGESDVKNPVISPPELQICRYNLSSENEPSVIMLPH